MRAVVWLTRLAEHPLQRGAGVGEREAAEPGTTMNGRA